MRHTTEKPLSLAAGMRWEHGPTELCVPVDDSGAPLSIPAWDYRVESVLRAYDLKARNLFFRGG